MLNVYIRLYIRYLLIYSSFPKLKAKQTTGTDAILIHVQLK